MKKIISTLVFIVIMFGVTRSQESIEVLYPEERVSIVKDHLYIIGKSTAPQINLIFNDEDTLLINVKDSFFHHFLEFGYGLHEIKLVPVNDKLDDSMLPPVFVEIMYAPLIDKKYKRLYPDYVFHDLNDKENCIKCHEYDIQRMQTNDNPDKCDECHRRITKSFKKHTDADNRSCILCHNFMTQANAMYADTKVFQNPCFKCHSDKINKFNKEYVHGPVAGGSCVVCHDPHASKYEKALQLPVQLLCISCHTDIEERLDDKVLHKPFSDGDCSDCHDPHSTNNQWVLLKKTEELCLNCHKPEELAQNHRHPYKDKPKRKLEVDLQLTVSGDLECLTCHNPHSAGVSHLLRSFSQVTCIGCHKE